MTDKVTIYLHSGSSVLATVTDEDLELETARLEDLDPENAGPGDAESLVETALTIPPRPRWAWIGDTLVFTQAVACVSVAGDTEKEN